MTYPSPFAMIMEWLALLLRGPLRAHQQSLKLWEAELRLKLMTDEAKKAISSAAYWKRIATKAVEAAGEAAAPSGQLSADEIKRLIKLCHPDKHENSKEANELTAKLLSLR